MKGLKKGFTLLELIVVISVIGVLGTFGYSKFAEIREDSKAGQYLDAIKKAESANSRVLATTGSIRPASVDSSGSYTNEESMRCFNFEDSSINGRKYVNLKNGDTEDMDEYGYEFAKTLKKELLGVGFKEKTNGGIYIQADPRSQFFSCYKNGVRFFAITGVKGSIALKALKEANNGVAPSVIDGKDSNRRAAIWKLAADTIYDHMEEDTEDYKNITSGQGGKFPYTNEELVNKAPSLTFTYSLTRGTTSGSKW